jgi:hypothetical protein
MGQNLSNDVQDKTADISERPKPVIGGRRHARLLLKADRLCGMLR